jgi:hypothetical protein
MQIGVRSAVEHHPRTRVLHGEPDHCRTAHEYEIAPSLPPKDRATRLRRNALLMTLGRIAFQPIDKRGLGGSENNCRHYATFHRSTGANLPKAAASILAP